MGAIARAAVLGMSALVLAAASTGGAATPATAAFSATLTGTIEESWQYRGRDVRDGCEFEFTSGGSRSVRFGSTAPSRVAVSRTRTGSVRVARGTIASLAGAVVRSLGANNAVSTECNRIIHADCFGSRTPFRSARVRLAHQPRGAFALGRLEHPALGGPLHTCGPTLREEVTGLGVAAGAVSARRLFDRRVPRVVVRGSYTHADPLGAPAFDDGVLHTRVTWTLVLRRRAP